MTTTTIETQIDHERLAEIDGELAEAEDQLGRTTVELERAKFLRDRASKRHTRAMVLRERILSGKDAPA